MFEGLKYYGTLNSYLERIIFTYTKVVNSDSVTKHNYWFVKIITVN